MVGDKDKLLAPRDYCETGYKLLSGAAQPNVEFEESPGHFTDSQCDPGRPGGQSNFPDYAGPLTETILLGNLAVWAAPEPGSRAKRSSGTPRT